MALAWKERKRSEGAYAAERMHTIICVKCGFGRTERFIDINEYPLLVLPQENGGLQVVDYTGKDILSRPMDPTMIARAE